MSDVSNNKERVIVKLIIAMERLRENIRKYGEKLPKKHGSWYRLKIYDDNYLVLDTWNGHVNHYKGCIPGGTDNMYRVVYTFSGFIGTVTKSMANFWNAHIYTCVSNIQ